MKTIRTAFLGLMLAVGLSSAAHAHGPNVGFNLQLGVPGFVAVAPPPVYIPPPAIYAPPPPVRYVAPAPVYAPSYGYPGYYYERRPHHWHGHRHWREERWER